MLPLNVALQTCRSLTAVMFPQHLTKCQMIVGPFHTPRDKPECLKEVWLKDLFRVLLVFEMLIPNGLVKKKRQ